VVGVFWGEIGPKGLQVRVAGALRVWELEALEPQGRWDGVPGRGSACFPFGEVARLGVTPPSVIFHTPVPPGAAPAH
jgi:hypothetical protein